MAVYKIKRFSFKDKFKVDEPTDLKELFRKYPKLKEMESIIKNKDLLIRLSYKMDNYGIIKDWEDLYVNLAEDLDEDMVPYLWYNTKNLRDELKSQDWISCMGGLCFNTKDNNFYLISYSPHLVLKMTTVKNYGKFLIKCIDAKLDFQQKYNEVTSQSINAAKEAKETVKRIFKI